MHFETQYSSEKGATTNTKDVAFNHNNAKPHKFDSSPEAFTA